MARLIASLSRRFKQSARRKAGAVCNGAGRPDGAITDARPPGSRNVSLSYQRILFSNPSASIEIEQVGTAAEQHMLAVVDNFAGTRMLIGRGATAQIRAPLK